MLIKCWWIVFFLRLFELKPCSLGSVDTFDNLIWTRPQHCGNISFCFIFLALIVSEILRSQKSVHWYFFFKFTNIMLARFGRLLWKFYKWQFRKVYIFWLLFQNDDYHSCRDIILTKTGRLGRFGSARFSAGLNWQKFKSPIWCNISW